MMKNAIDKLFIQVNPTIRLKIILDKETIIMQRHNKANNFDSMLILRFRMFNKLIR